MKRLCTKCQRSQGTMWDYCPYCGNKLEKIEQLGKKPPPVYYPVEEVMAYLQPIIDLNGITWLANRVGCNESRVRQLPKQKTVSEIVVDEWFTKLGITHAIEELTPVGFGRIKPPPSQYWEE